MAIIQDFTGGLNNKLDKTRILDNQAQIFKNINILSYTLKSINTDKQIMKSNNLSPYYFNGFWVFDNSGTSYARLLGLAYKAYNEEIKKLVKGVWYNLYIEPPEEAPKVELYTDNVFNGSDIRYCYTYYNENDGSESAPSPYSAIINVNNKSTKITVVASNDPQITHIKLYRLGGGLTNFTLVRTLPNKSEVYIDNIKTSDVSELLSTLSYNEPPRVSYICAYYALLFGISAKNKNMLYYSDEANPLAWNPLNYIIFDEDIVGIGASSLGLLVFTSYRVYIIYGTEIATFQRYLLYDNVGCKSHNSIQSYNGMLIWQGDDGIYLFDGSNCKNITLMKTDINNIIIASCMNDNVYYGLLDNGNIITINFNIENYPIVLFCGNYKGITAALNKVYVTKDNYLYELHSDTELQQLHWKSKAYSENAITILKNYKYVQIYIQGNFRFKCYIDGKIAADIELTNGYNEIKLSQENRIGYYIEFELIGFGNVLELAYSFESRLQSRGI